MLEIAGGGAVGWGRSPGFSGFAEQGPSARTRSHQAGPLQRLVILDSLRLCVDATTILEM